MSREAVLGEVIHGDEQPESGWFILGVDGYFDVDNAVWCEPQDDDVPWDSEHFELHGSLPDIIAERDALAARLAKVEALAERWAADPDGLPRADVCARQLTAVLAVPGQHEEGEET